MARGICKGHAQHLYAENGAACLRCGTANPAHRPVTVDPALARQAAAELKRRERDKPALVATAKFALAQARAARRGANSARQIADCDAEISRRLGALGNALVYGELSAA